MLSLLSVLDALIDLHKYYVLLKDHIYVLLSIYIRWLSSFLRSPFRSPVRRYLGFYGGLSYCTFENEQHY